MLSLLVSCRLARRRHRARPRSPRPGPNYYPVFYWAPLGSPSRAERNALVTVLSVTPRARAIAQADMPKRWSCEAFSAMIW
jgi:hypothetical protein